MQIKDLSRRYADTPPGSASRCFACVLLIEARVRCALFLSLINVERQPARCAIGCRTGAHELALWYCRARPLSCRAIVSRAPRNENCLRHCAARVTPGVQQTLTDLDMVALAPNHVYDQSECNGYSTHPKHQSPVSGSRGGSRATQTMLFQKWAVRGDWNSSHADARYPLVS